MNRRPESCALDRHDTAQRADVGAYQARPSASELSHRRLGDIRPAVIKVGTARAAADGWPRSPGIAWKSVGASTAGQRADSRRRYMSELSRTGPWLRPSRNQSPGPGPDPPGAAAVDLWLLAWLRPLIVRERPSTVNGAAHLFPPAKTAPPEKDGPIGPPLTAEPLRPLGQKPSGQASRLPPRTRAQPGQQEGKQSGRLMRDG